MKKLIISNLFLLTLIIQCIQGSESEDDKIVYQPKSLVEFCLASKNQNGISLSEQYVQAIVKNIKSNQQFDKGLMNEILGNFKIAKHLKPYLNEQNVLHDAVSRDDYQAVEWLLQTGVDVNYRDHNGFTSLHYAQTAGQTRLLLAAGANVNARTNDGSTPLHNARTIEQIKLLLAAGANVNAKSLYGSTPLHVYCRCRYRISWEQIKVIIFAGADENTKYLSMTPVEYLSLASSKYLIDRKKFNKIIEKRNEQFVNKKDDTAIKLFDQ